jgi:hypothetical protein
MYKQITKQTNTHTHTHTFERTTRHLPFNSRKRSTSIGMETCCCHRDGLIPQLTCIYIYHNIIMVVISFYYFYTIWKRWQSLSFPLEALHPTLLRFKEQTPNAFSSTGPCNTTIYTSFHRYMNVHTLSWLERQRYSTRPLLLHSLSLFLQFYSIVVVPSFVRVVHMA